MTKNLHLIQVEAIPFCKFYANDLCCKFAWFNMQRIQINTSKNFTRRRVYLSEVDLSIGGNDRQRLAGEIVNHTQDAEAAPRQDLAGFPNYGSGNP